MTCLSVATVARDKHGPVDNPGGKGRASSRGACKRKRELSREQAP